MQRLRLVSAIGWGFPTWDENDAASLLAEIGIPHVQVFRNIHKDIPAADIRSGLAGHGLKVASLHAFFGDEYDPGNPDESARRRNVDNLAREADYCLELGGNLVVVHPGDAILGPATRDTRRVDALVRSGEQLAAVGERTGVVFSLENLQPGQMGDDMAMLRGVADKVDSLRLGLNYDCGHANLTSDPMTVLRQAGPRIVSTHIHDNHGREDEHVAPGFGNIDMDAVCRELAEVNYHGDFTLELMETVDSVRAKCDGQWLAKLNRWLDLASGIEPAAQ